MNNRVMKAVESKMRENRVKDGYYDGRFSTKSVPNKRQQFLEEMDVDFDEYMLDEREYRIEPSPHRK